MSTTTTTAAIRSGKVGSPANVSLNAEIVFDPTQATAKTGFILPKGSVVTGVLSLGGSTGGTSPTVDIGIDGDSVFFANELDAEAAEIGTLAASLAKTTEDIEIFAGVGASAATGGATTVVLQYYRT